IRLGHIKHCLALRQKQQIDPYLLRILPVGKRHHNSGRPRFVSAACIVVQQAQASDLAIGLEKLAKRQCVRAQLGRNWPHCHAGRREIWGGGVEGGRDGRMGKAAAIVVAKTTAATTTSLDRRHHCSRPASQNRLVCWRDGGCSGGCCSLRTVWA